LEAKPSAIPGNLYTSLTGLVLLSSASIVSGVVYIILQWSVSGEIRDSLFVSLLILATMVLMMGIVLLKKYLVSKGLEFYSFVLASVDPEESVRRYQALCRSILHFGLMTLSGALYGSAIAVSPIALNVWKGEPSLQASLFAFMFCVNFATGIGFYGMVVFFWKAYHLGEIVKVDLWHTQNPSTIFLLGLSRRLSLLASIYICISLSSILFSLLPIGKLVIGYSVFSGVIILISLFLPSYPVMKKLSAAKRGTLSEVDVKLNELFTQIVSDMKKEGGAIDLGKFESLLRFREKVEAIQTFPFRVKAISAGVSVLVLSSIPVLLRFALTMVLFR
jgi:hypothetical protein